MNDDLLKLDDQICFRFYVLSRLITRSYQPYLEKLGITYPQYLVLMVLWEQDKQPVNDIGKRLFLNTNTITPLLKRMESDAIITRERDKVDERRIIISLTEKGIRMKKHALCIPTELVSLLLNQGFEVSELTALRSQLDLLMGTFSKG